MKHQTLNSKHQILIETDARRFDVRRSAFDVGCSMF